MIPVLAALAAVPGAAAAGLASPGTVIGGYGMILATWDRTGPDGPTTATADLNRLVVFVSHDFSGMGAPIAAYTELEWEHAIACDGCEGAVEVEQAYLDARLHGDALTLRAGLVLVPMGIVNQWHEPPVFHGADRPQVDQVVIPTTWRELGVGFTGRAGIARWEAYAVTPLDPTALTADGLAPARTGGSFSSADTVAGTGRFEVEPALGVVLGASGYAADLGPAGDWYSAAGEKLDLSLPLYGGAIDARARRAGFEARVVGALWGLPQSDDLMEALRADGSPYFAEGAAPVPTRIQGGYVELAYDVLHPFDVAGQLLPFVRLEGYNTQAAVPEGWEADLSRSVQEATFGLSYRPIPAIVVKGDVQLRDRRYGDDTLQAHLGLGWMF